MVDLSCKQFSLHTKMIKTQVDLLSILNIFFRLACNLDLNLDDCDWVRRKLKKQLFFQPCHSLSAAEYLFKWYFLLQMTSHTTYAVMDKYWLTIIRSMFLCPTYPRFYAYRLQIWTQLTRDSWSQRYVPYLSCKVAA